MYKLNIKKIKKLLKGKVRLKNVKNVSLPIRTTVDDPSNDVFDDELYFDELYIPKEDEEMISGFDRSW